MLEPSKETTKYVVEWISSCLRMIPLSDDSLGIFSVFIHIVFGLSLIYALLRNRINKTYYLYVIIWFIVIYSNYFFHGCILSRVERHLFKNTNWNGPASLLEWLFNAFGTTASKDNVNLFIKYGIAAPVCTIIIIKILFSFDLLLSLILCFLWIPLLFIHSQQPIFDNLKKPHYELDEKVIAITGCSSGIGESLALSLLEKGSTVILLNRKSSHAASFYKKVKNRKVVNIECDLNSFKSVEAACKVIIDKFPDGIDALYNNAGINNKKVELTEDGYETHIQTNYLSHILLTNRLLSILKKKNGKVINTNSIAYRLPYERYNPLFFEKNSIVDSSNTLYQQSKLAMLLYSQKLKDKIQVINVQPGICNTSLFDNSLLPNVIVSLIKLVSTNSDKGKEYLLNALFDETADSEKLYGPNLFFINSTNIDKNLVNSIDIDKAYNHTNTHLGLAL